MTKTPEIISQSLKEGWNHVFFISNPINALLARMIIEAYSINISNVICVSIRNSSTDLISETPIRPTQSLSDRVLAKLFNDSPSGRRIRRTLERKERDFLVYASWMYPEISKVVSSTLCKGHIYMEEGQQAYYRSQPYKVSSPHTKSVIDKKRQQGKTDYLYREDAAAYIGLSPSSFPSIEEKKRFILKNYDAIQPFYTPKLFGITTIGIMPAPNRIPKEYLHAAVELFIEKMPQGGVIKLHPGFNIHPLENKHVREVLATVSNKNVTLCDDNTIIEMEMLSEPKILIGARSSLERYSEAFGSKYKIINFKGYIPPKN